MTVPLSIDNKGAEKKKKMIHVYTGDGKGKTTASIGLAVRACGRGKKVIFAQFLKSAVTGEIASLEKLGVKIMHSVKSFGFTNNMDENTKTACRNEQEELLDRIISAVNRENADLLILDEVLDAVNAEMLDENSLKLFTETKRAETELVLTGRNLPLWLLEKADYVSEIKQNQTSL
jgi:cob(I)alamin adenosyltransferase